MIGVIEQAIMDRLRAASDTGTLGYHLAAVESYAGQLDGELSAVLRERAPAAWVVFNGETRDDKTGTRHALARPLLGGRAGACRPQCRRPSLRRR